MHNGSHFIRNWIAANGKKTMFGISGSILWISLNYNFYSRKNFNMFFPVSMQKTSQPLYDMLKIYKIKFISQEFAIIHMWLALMYISLHMVVVVVVEFAWDTRAISNMKQQISSSSSCGLKKHHVKMSSQEICVVFSSLLMLMLTRPKLDCIIFNRATINYSYRFR